MAGDAIAAAEAEVRAAQADLARDLDALSERLPQPDDLVKAAALAAGSAVGTWLVLSWLLGRRRRRRDERRLKRLVREAVAETDRA